MVRAVGWAMPSKTRSFRSPLICLTMLGQGLGSPSKRWPFMHIVHTRHGSMAPLPLARQKTSRFFVTKAFPAHRM